MKENTTNFGTEKYTPFQSPTESLYYAGDRGKEIVGNRTTTEAIEISPKKYDEIFEGFEIPNSPQYSIGFVQHQTKKMVTDLIRAFTSWGMSETGDSLHVIVEIRKTLQKYVRYLQINDESRILIGILESIFTTSQWTSLSSSQIQTITKELERFEDGVVSDYQIDVFSNQLNRAGIGII